MQWTHPCLPTFTGLDVLLWVAAYVVWRYFTGLGRVRQSAAMPLPAAKAVAIRPGAARCPGRWAARAAVLQKLEAGQPRKAEERKELRRAA